jgi:hypothetical protein
MESGCWQSRLSQQVFVIPKQSGPQWLCEMTALMTAQHKTMKVWAILQTSYQHGQGLQESLSCHNQTLNAIAILANI